MCACVRFFSRVPSLRPFDAELHCLAEPQEIEREDQAERQRESGRTPGLSGTRHTEMNLPGVTRGRRGARRVCEGARGGRGAEVKVEEKKKNLFLGYSLFSNLYSNSEKAKGKKKTLRLRFKERFIPRAPAVKKILMEAICNSSTEGTFHL